ncbi:unnamed protein product, partial [Ixodes hexagonus]
GPDNHVTSRARPRDPERARGVRFRTLFNRGVETHDLTTTLLLRRAVDHGETPDRAGGAVCRRRDGTGGSALDLVELQRSEEMGASTTTVSSAQGAAPDEVKESRLRRVLTAHVRRQSKKPRQAGFSLNSLLKEPLRLVNSVPLNFDFGR